MQLKSTLLFLEARCLNIPIVAPLDTNCDPDLITYPIPGNDDAIRSIQLFCREMTEAINEGKALSAAPVEEEQTEEVEASEEAAPVAEEAPAATKEA